MPDAPHGLTLARLQDAPDARHAAARRFCLDLIEDVYGTPYRADWHVDLDSLTLEPAASWFSRRNRGAFWTLAAADGTLVATAGVFELSRKSSLATLLAEHYPQPARVAQLVRVYIREDQRGRRIGRWLNAVAEAEARRLGYDTLYLHASVDAPATIDFWRGRGYAPFLTQDGHTHFDKDLHLSKDLPSNAA